MIGPAAHVSASVSSGETRGGEKFESVEFGSYCESGAKMTSP